MSESNLISIHDAVEHGIERIRRPIWANAMDHLKLTLLADGLGPWIRLYGLFNKECNHCDPVEVLWIQFDLDVRQYEPYTGPLPESDEYKAEVYSTTPAGSRQICAPDVGG